ncbi:hypothetical protein HYW36_01925 [Candidatus Saccharibacteria bacterium]|nr:hypothetical protein [Candidatus Saccharibacteria bacterium]
MRFFKEKFKLPVLVTIAALLVVSWLVFKPDNKGSSPASQTAQTTAPTSQTGQQTGETKATGQPLGTFVEKTDYKYEVPSGWVEIKKEALDQAGADSGIGRVAALAATFRIKISFSTPSNDNQLRNNTLDDIKKNAPNFALLSTTSTKVDGKSGYVFVYTFSDTSSKQKFRHQLSAVPNKGKTFFLLSSSVDSDFDKQTSEFKKITDSFKFK